MVQILFENLNKSTPWRELIDLRGVMCPLK